MRLSQKHAIFKYSSEEDYLTECFKAFDKAGITSDKTYSHPTVIGDDSKFYICKYDRILCKLLYNEKKKT